MIQPGYGIVRHFQKLFPCSFQISSYEASKLDEMTNAERRQYVLDNVLKPLNIKL